jgi:hypothetical protein
VLLWGLVATFKILLAFKKWDGNEEINWKEKCRFEWTGDISNNYRLDPDRQHYNQTYVNWECPCSSFS